jgi:hypothetical protein
MEDTAITVTGNATVQNIIDTRESSRLWEERSLALLHAVSSALRRNNPDFTVPQLVDALAATWIEKEYIKGHAEAAEAEDRQWHPELIPLRNYVDKGMPGMSTATLLEDGPNAQKESVYEHHAMLISILIHEMAKRSR